MKSSGLSAEDFVFRAQAAGFECCADCAAWRPVRQLVWVGEAYWCPEHRPEMKEADLGGAILARWQHTRRWLKN